MGSASSSTAKPIAAEDIKGQYIYPESSGSSKSQKLSMALTIDNQVQIGDDFGQDTLMGLQELDSQLAIFEGSADMPNGASTTDSVSDIISDLPQNSHDVQPRIQVQESNIINLFSKVESASLPSRTLQWEVKSNGTLMYVLTVSFIKQETTTCFWNFGILTLILAKAIAAFTDPDKWR